MGDSLGGSKAWVNWLVAVLFPVLVFTLQTGYAITNTYVAKDLSLSIAQVGFVGSLYTWVFAVAQFTSGSVLDRIGLRVLPYACGLVTLGAFIFANANGPWMLLLAQVFLAVGASYGFIGAGFVGGQWFEPIKYGLMFSLVQFVASTSALVGQNALSFLITELSWRELMNALAIGGVGISILMFCLLRDPADSRESHSWPGVSNFLHNLVESINRVAAIQDSWINALIGGATFGSMLALGVIWGPRLLIASGMDSGSAYSVTSLSWFGMAIGAPAIAWLSQKMKSRKRPMFAACLLQLGIIILILANPRLEVAQASLLFFVWGFLAGGSMISFTIGMELVDKTLAGTSAALVNATQFIVGGILMAIPGRVLAGTGLIARIADIQTPSAETLVDYQWALLVYPLVLGLSLLLFLFLKETYPEASK